MIETSIFFGGTVWITEGLGRVGFEGCGGDGGEGWDIGDGGSAEGG